MKILSIGRLDLNLTSQICKFSDIIIKCDSFLVRFGSSGYSYSKTRTSFWFTWFINGPPIKIHHFLVRNSPKPENGTIEISTSQKRNRVNNTFADTGTSISEEILGNFFALFITKEQGMSFGLAICKPIVEAHRATYCEKYNKQRNLLHNFFTS